MADTTYELHITFVRQSYGDRDTIKRVTEALGHKVIRVVGYGLDDTMTVHQFRAPNDEFATRYARMVADYMGDFATVLRMKLEAQPGADVLGSYWEAHIDVPDNFDALFPHDAYSRSSISFGSVRCLISKTVGKDCSILTVRGNNLAEITQRAAQVSRIVGTAPVIERVVYDSNCYHDDVWQA